MSPEDLIGEIVARRYAVLEYLGVDRFLVYDMETMRRTVVPLGLDGSVLSWDDPPAPNPPPATAPPAPARRDPPTLVSVPPPTPRAAPPPVPRAEPAPRRRVDTHRFEAAWFARGEQLQHEEEDEAEVTDYIDYQARLEKLALELP